MKKYIHKSHTFSVELESLISCDFSCSNRMRLKSEYLLIALVKPNLTLGQFEYF